MGSKQFKPVYGNWSTQCRFCTVCGGRNQNGLQYDFYPCTAFSDAVCRPCKSCPPESGVLVGCCSIFEGDCFLIAPNVTAIEATSAGQLDLVSLSALSFITESTLMLQLLGDFHGYNLVIPNQAQINFTQSIRNVSLSVIVPSPDMIFSANKSGTSLMSEIVFCGPEDVSIVPYANLTLQTVGNLQMRRMSTTNVSANVSVPLLKSNLSLAPSLPIRLCLWSSTSGKWEPMQISPLDSSQRSETYPISVFSVYVLCTVAPGTSSAQQNETNTAILVLAIILPIAFFSAFSIFCIWRWKKWKNSQESKPDFSSTLMLDPGQSDQEVLASEVHENTYSEGSTIQQFLQSQTDERSPYGTLNTGMKYTGPTRVFDHDVMPVRSLDSYPQYRIECDVDDDDQDESTSSRGFHDDTHSQFRGEDISVTERPPLVFSNRFAPKLEDVQGQTWNDKTNAAALYSYRAESSELASSSDEEPIEDAAGLRGKRADWMC